MNHLDLTANYGVDFDTELLKLSPSLVFLKLGDFVYQYKCRDIVTRSPFRLYDFTDLTLTGWPALAFHSDTLQSTRILKKLELSLFTCEGHPCLIPPVDELNRLFGEQGYSILDDDKTLDLNMRTGGFDHSRVITRADLIVSGGEDDRPSAQRRYTVLPLLRFLKLQGWWKISETALSDLLPGMLPNLERLTVMDWSKCTLKDLMSAVKTMGNIKEIEIDFPQPSEKEVKSLKLLDYDDFDESTEWLKTDARMIKLSFPHRAWMDGRNECDGFRILKGYLPLETLDLDLQTDKNSRSRPTTRAELSEPVVKDDDKLSVVPRWLKRLKAMSNMQTILTDLRQDVEGLGLRKYLKWHAASKKLAEDPTMVEDRVHGRSA
ncbi:hypothetical protein BGZ47_010938 [Haplosporangium gracile]|nr:hypothetical protein BGZ47_010938 [Haplosporangium gracile]